VWPSTEKNPINPWGFFVTAEGRFRIFANGTGNSPLLNDDGLELGRAVIIPPPAGSAKGVTSALTGDVANTMADFVITFGHGVHHDSHSASINEPTGI
jgi:hypothetical protein